LPVFIEALSVIALDVVKKFYIFTGLSLLGSMCAAYLVEVGFLSFKKVFGGSSRLSEDKLIE
jgi:hypothetical protein